MDRRRRFQSGEAGVPVPTLGGEKYGDDTGRVLLEEGTRRSRVNNNRGLDAFENMDEFLEMLNKHLMARRGKQGSRRERMSGLFGGNRDR